MNPFYSSWFTVCIQAVCFQANAFYIIEGAIFCLFKEFVVFSRTEFSLCCSWPPIKDSMSEGSKVATTVEFSWSNTCTKVQKGTWKPPKKCSPFPWLGQFRMPFLKASKVICCYSMISLVFALFIKPCFTSYGTHEVSSQGGSLIFWEYFTAVYSHNHVDVYSTGTQACSVALLWRKIFIVVQNERSRYLWGRNILGCC